MFVVVLLTWPTWKKIAIFLSRLCAVSFACSLFDFNHLNYYLCQYLLYTCVSLLSYFLFFILILLLFFFLILDYQFTHMHMCRTHCWIVLNWYRERNVRVRKLQTHSIKFIHHISKQNSSTHFTRCIIWAIVSDSPHIFSFRFNGLVCDITFIRWKHGIHLTYSPKKKKKKLLKSVFRKAQSPYCSWGVWFIHSSPSHKCHM